MIAYIDLIKISKTRTDNVFIAILKKCVFIVTNPPADLSKRSVRNVFPIVQSRINQTSLIGEMV